MSNTTANARITNRNLLMPYAVPYLAYVGIVSLGQERISTTTIYILEILVVPLLLAWAWKWYVPLSGPKNRVASILWGVVFGLAGLVVWCVLLAPFIDMAGDPWQVSDFVLRAVAATFIVPVFEEIFIRGYVLRLALQWEMNRNTRRFDSPLGRALDNDNIGDVAPGAWSVMAVAISSVVFALGHMPVEWPASVGYSVLICVLWVMRKDLLSCIVAHGVTNLGLAAYVYLSGHWGFW